MLRSNGKKNINQCLSHQCLNRFSSNLQGKFLTPFRLFTKKKIVCHVCYVCLRQILNYPYSLLPFHSVCNFYKDIRKLREVSKRSRDVSRPGQSSNVTRAGTVQLTCCQIFLKVQWLENVFVVFKIVGNILKICQIKKLSLENV